MIISNHYLLTNDALATNTVAMHLLNRTKDFRYIGMGMVDALVFAGFLPEMSAADLTTVANHRKNGYRISLKGTSSANLFTKFPFLASLFSKVILDGGEITAFELNTLFKLGYVKGKAEADA